MTQHKNLSIFPEYDEEKGIFLGYSIKQNNLFLKDTNGNKIILSVQTKNKNNYAVSYQGNEWILNVAEHEKNIEPLLKFTPKTIKGVFKGYDIKQYDNKEKALMPRGTILPIDVKYKQKSNGYVDCFYEDKQTDGTCQTYLIQQISHDEYTKKRISKIKK